MGKKKVDSDKRNKSTQNSNHSSAREDDHDHDHEPIDVEKLKDFVDPLKLQQDQFTDTTESEASSARTSNNKLEKREK
ncbi:hypothetical protein KY285_002687 [Solanum tuberosum]|nr:hypothetical protein KY285_002687 [Solanum tuberosum]